MKSLCMVLALVFSPAALNAGAVYGTLRENGHRLSKVKVEILAGATVYATQTGSDGVYNIFVDRIGKVTFSVSYNGQKPSTQVFSYEDPVKFDFDLIKEKETGRYLIRRR